MTETTGYVIYVDAGSSGVNWKMAEELGDNIRKKHGVQIFFPIEYSSSRHAHNPQAIHIPKRDLDLLDDVLDIIYSRYYNQVTGIERRVN